MKESYSQVASSLTHDIYTKLVPILLKSKFSKEVNYTKCIVEILDNDYSTIWVKWGTYDCEFSDLPLRAMATITDNILIEEQQKGS